MPAPMTTTLARLGKLAIEFAPVLIPVAGRSSGDAKGDRSWKPAAGPHKARSARRLTVDKPGVNLDPCRRAAGTAKGKSMTALAHKQLWETVADRLRDEILDGRLPAGSRLVEAELAVRFGVSRGPIRDALTELARGGLALAP